MAEGVWKRKRKRAGREDATGEAAGGHGGVKNVWDDSKLAFVGVSVGRSGMRIRMVKEHSADAS